jgi:hypothetical protein
LRHDSAAFVLCLAAVAASPAVAGVGPPPPVPGDGNTYVLYVGADEGYDGNLYRLPTGTSASTTVFPGATRADHVTTVSAGGDLQRLLGRQLFLLDLHADENRFAHNTALNNTSGYANLLWQWGLGPYLSGTAGASFSRGLVSFGEALFLGRDMLDSTAYFGTARYQAGPHWAVYGGVSDSAVSHSAAAATNGNFHTLGGNAGLEYALDTADTFALEFHYDEGRYPAAPAVPYTFDGKPFNPDFHDDTLLFVVKHSFSSKTQLTADAGYMKRYYPNTTVGAFSGDVWRVTLTWEPTEKTQVDVAGWRELHAYLNSQSNYFVSQGASIKPTWFPTAKLSLFMRFSYETQDYIPQSTSVSGITNLNSKVATEQATINYSPRSAWTLSLSFRHTTRTANLRSFDYGDDVADFGVVLKTH